MAEPKYLHELVTRLSGYFDRPIFSDVTIRSQMKDFYAHRLVLASQSRYFNRELYNLDTSTGRTLHLDLTSENCLVVEGVLFFLYNADYKDGFPSRKPEILNFNLQMSAAAERYGISALKDCALKKLNVAASQFWDTNHFIQIIVKAYSEGNPAHDRDRAVVARIAAEHCCVLIGKPLFLDILRSNNLFRAEFEDIIEKTRLSWQHCMYCNRVHDLTECAHVWSG